MENATGVTVIEARVGALTTTVPMPLMPVMLAVTVTEPALKAVKRPPPDTPATEESEVLHTTWEVRFWVLLSEYTPVAVSCSVPPDASEGDGVPTLIDERTGASTVTTILPVIESFKAETVTEPDLKLERRPEELVVAIATFEVDHVT